MYINSIIVCGNLTRDPELKALPSGQYLCSLTLAINEVYTDRDGKRQEKVEFISCVLFGKQAENTAKYLKKGDQALVEGKISTRSYEKDGVKHYRTEVVGQSIQFGAKRSDKPAEPSKVPNTSVDYPEEEIDASSISF